MSDITMREYVDGIQGPGAWDKMHDAIANFNLNGWAMPPVEVDGMKVYSFPGTDREVTLAQVTDQIRKAMNNLTDSDFDPDKLWVSHFERIECSCSP